MGIIKLITAVHSNTKFNMRNVFGSVAAAGITLLKQCRGYSQYVWINSAQYSYEPVNEISKRLKST